MTKIIRDRAFYGKLAALSLPIAAQNLITFSVGLADNLMVSTLGETSLSGVYMANQIMTLLQMLVLGLSAAMSILAAQYWGKGDTKSLRSIVSIGFLFSIFVGIFFCAASFLFPEQVLSLFTNEPAVIEKASEYLQIVCFTYPLFCLTNILIVSMRCVENTRIGMYISFVALAVNVSLNYVLIFGKLSFPALGVRGAAIATLVSRIAELIIITLIVFVFDKRLKLRPTDLFKPNKLLVKDFFKYGLPVILGDMLWGVNLACQSAIVGRLGESAISAVSIASTVFSMLTVLAYGLRDGASVMTGKAVGTNNVTLVKQYTKSFQLVFVLVGLFCGALIFFSKDLILLFYSRNGMDQTTIEIARQFLIVLSVTSIGTAYQMAALTGIVRAGGDTKFVLINDIIFVWCVVLPSAFLAAFVFNAPPVIVFACLKCDQILKCFVAIVKVNKFNWIKNLTREELSSSK